MSDGIGMLDQKIQQFQDLLEEMRAETREAHSTLKQIRKEREEITKTLTNDVKKMVNDRAAEVVKKELDVLGPQIREQTKLIYEKVGKQIDILIDLSMGKRFAVDHGRSDIRPQLASKLRIFLNEIVRDNT